MAKFTLSVFYSTCVKISFILVPHPLPHLSPSPLPASPLLSHVIFAGIHVYDCDLCSHYEKDEVLMAVGITAVSTSLSEFVYTDKKIYRF